MESKTAGEETLKKIRVPWIKLLVIVVLFTLFNRFLSMIAGDLAFGVAWSGGWLKGPFTIHAFLLIIASMIPSLSRRISMTTLTLLYVAMMMAIANSSSWGTYNIMSSALDCRIAKPEVESIIPEWWIPPKEAAMPALLGGGGLRLDVWMPTFVTWIGIPIICFLMFTAMMSIVRRRWVEIEDLPYPLARMAYEVQSVIVDPWHPDRVVKTRMVLIGFVMTVALALPYFINIMLPWIPNVYLLAGIPLLQSIDTGKYAPWLYNTIHGIEDIGLQLEWLFIGYLLPMSTLNSAVLAFIIRHFAPNVLVTLGYPSVWHGAAILEKWPFGLSPLLYGGMIPGMMLFWLFVNKDYLANTLKAAFGTAPPEFKEREKEEPMSYRMAYITLIVCFIAIYVFTTALIGRADVALFVAGGALLWDGFMRSRVYAYTAMGGPASGWEREGSLYYGWFYVNPATNKPYDWVPSTLGPEGRDLIWAGTLAERWMGTSTNSWGWTQGWYAWAGDAFKLAYLSGTPAKTVFKVMAVMMVVSIMVSVPFGLLIWHGIGAKALPEHEGCKLYHVYGRLTRNPIRFEPVNPTLGGVWVSLPWIGTGLVLGTLITFAQSRFAWFPFDVAGFYLSWSPPPTKYGVDTMIVVAWLLKLVTIKLAGAKAYERYGTPFMSGAMVGYNVALLLYTIAVVYKVAIMFGLI